LIGRLFSSSRVSVAMCTYEGERYLQEQLQSIVGQTRPPDELIVCDDGSTDGTLAILDRFRSQTSLPVRVHVNEERIGPTKNFERAITLCEGDIIFLSDQDDVWRPEKLEVLAAAFARSPGIGAVFSNADVVDERLEPRGYSVWNAVGFTPALQRKFVRDGALDVLLKRNVVGGMTMGFRSRFRDLIVPLPADWFHDVWIPLLIAAVSTLTMFPRRLVKYRQHLRQKVGLATSGLAHKVTHRRQVDESTLLREARHYVEARERLNAKTASFPCSPNVLRKLEAKVGHIRARARIKSGNGRLGPLMREVLSLNYQRYSSGWRSIAVDAFLS
jgi:glycosyltransferase involved in cell wall biosynthesis